MMLRRAALRLVVATFAVACCAVLGWTIMGWSFSGRFRLSPDWRDSLFVSGAALGISAAGCTIVFGAAAIARRWLPDSRWLGAFLGVALWYGFVLIAANPSAPPRANVDMALVGTPLAMLAGLFAWRPSAPLSRGPLLLLGSGILAWSGLILAAGLEARRAAVFEAQLLAGPNFLSQRILGGVTLGEEVWLFDSRGRAASIDPSSGQATLRVGGNVIAMTADADALWLLLASPSDQRLEDDPPGLFRLARYRASAWRTFARIRYPVNERPLALAIGPGGPLVISRRRLVAVDRDSGASTVRLLSAENGRAGLATSLVVGQQLYIGVNKGEWGGELRRISLADGRVSVFGRDASGDTCSGPFSPSCDPVTALVPDDTHPSCLFAATGLSHFGLRGRVLRVCEDGITQVFSQPIMPIGERVRRFFSAHARSFPPRTEAVFGLLAEANGFTAVTPRAIYRWRGGNVTRTSFPTLHPRHGLAISTEIPGLILITTDANAASSLSGVTPMVFRAPRG